MSKKYKLGNTNIYIDEHYAFRWSRIKGHLEISRWLLSLYSREKLNILKYNLENIQTFYFGDDKVTDLLIKEEIEKRKRTYIGLILFLFEKKYKMLDINAIAIVWKSYI